MDSRTLVRKTLEFDRPGRVPRHKWVLPWADHHHPQAMAALRKDFPDDIEIVPQLLTVAPPPTRGDAYEVGAFVDEWGTVWENRQRGIIGEVKEPIIRDWADLSAVRFPREHLTVDRGAVNAFCRNSERFVLAGCLPRPFERLQFLRGSENTYIDLALEDADMLAFLERLHRFNCDLLEAWVATDVDGIFFMDDWGGQKSLLINPDQWRRHFKDRYREYIAIAHSAGKKAFMHSDGHILAIYPDLIEIGLDALNSQVFCMGLEHLAAFRGRISFWGEIDRQHILPANDPDLGQRAVADFMAALWADGGVIAQCEFGPGANPELVRVVYAAWERYRF